MIDSLVNLLFRCNHRRLTRPMTPVAKDGESGSGTYVLCLDCGKQFAYDLREMRIGKPLPLQVDKGVLRPQAKPARRSRWKYALAASAIPAVFLIGKALRKPRKAPPARSDSEPK
jgi:hypothetical protein